MKNTVAIIGKPNVGKSTLFNRFIGKRVSIVYDQPGVTRDRLYEVIEWSGKQIKVIDTGGIEIENKPFQEQIQIQAKIAIEEADVIIFIVDGTSEITNDDAFIINLLRKSDKPIVVVANKLESNKNFDYSWYKLGVEKIFLISALHGEGVGDVLDKCLSYLDFETEEDDKFFKLSIIGKPNAGKSSLLNNLAKENRSIVSEIAGTTRDSVKSNVVINGKNYNIIDTAGITRKSRLVESVDHYALLRAMNSLSEADLSLIILDATAEVSHFDSRIIGYALENNKPIIIIINKWDLIKKETNTMANYEKTIRFKFHFVPWVPFVFISAKYNQRLDKLISTLEEVRENLSRDISPSLLSKFIMETQMIQPAPSYNGGRLNIYFVRKSLNKKIPTFVFFVNNKKFLHFSYQRYLENQIRSSFNFKGCPIKIEFKNKKGVE